MGYKYIYIYICCHSLIYYFSSTIQYCTYNVVIINPNACIQAHSYLDTTPVQLQKFSGCSSEGSWIVHVWYRHRCAVLTLAFHTSTQHFRISNQQTSIITWILKPIVYGYMCYCVWFEGWVTCFFCYYVTVLTKHITTSTRPSRKYTPSRGK